MAGIRSLVRESEPLGDGIAVDADDHGFFLDFQTADLDLATGHLHLRFLTGLEVDIIDQSNLSSNALEY